MVKKAEKALIGIFVIGALVLFIVAVVIFGSGRFFKDTKKFIVFFDTSIKGLNVGAPVMFRGVKIGSVTDIKIMMSDAEKKINIPVFIELDPSDLGGKDVFSLERDQIDSAIVKGLRAQLQIQSFVTGQLLVALDFFPATPITLLGYVKDFQEIPVVPTRLEELERTLNDLPLKDMVKKLDSVVGGVEKLVNAAETRESIASVNATLNDTQRFIERLDKKMDPLLTNLTKVTETADKSLVVTQDTLLQARQTMATIEKDMNELIKISQKLSQTTNETLKDASSALKQTEKTLGTFSEDSQLIYEFNTLLKELSGAAGSLRNLSDYLERHPEALIRGKNKE